MQVSIPAYNNGVPMDVGPLETALYEAVAEKVGVTPEQVAQALFGRHEVPSDAFYAAYDDEVSVLTERYRTSQAVTHTIQIGRRASGWGWRCSCGESPNQAWKRRADAERSAGMHEASRTR